MEFLSYCIIKINHDMSTSLVRDDINRNIIKSDLLYSNCILYTPEYAVKIVCQMHKYNVINLIKLLLRRPMTNKLHGETSWLF